MRNHLKLSLLILLAVFVCTTKTEKFVLDKKGSVTVGGKKGKFKIYNKTKKFKSREARDAYHAGELRKMNAEDTARFQSSRIVGVSKRTEN